MTDIVLTFEVHQPFRIKKSFYWEHRIFQRRPKQEIFNHYFDRPLNRDIFERACRKCYLPTNQILLNLIDRYKREKRKVKVAFSLSGVFLEQCEAFNKDVLESFNQLAETGCVEFLDQTYYHSLASLYPKKDEFFEQVTLHRQVMHDLLHSSPTVFENTELLYNNSIAKLVEEVGYAGIFTEGADRLLEGRSPNHIYMATGCNTLKVLLRNYRLTDDIGFRFSARWWSEWPLTAPKYADWLAATKGDCINIFPDYETFGEHHWPETGIHEFLAHLPQEIFKFEHLQMATPSEVLQKHKPIGIIEAPEAGGTVSWADIERGVGSWLGNTMQWACYTSVRDMEPLVGETQDRDFKTIWRHLQASDHLYYMFTTGGSPGEVHAYFNPFGNPVDAFLAYHNVIMDFEWRMRMFTFAGDYPFRFYTKVGEEGFTGESAHSLKGFVETIPRVPVEALEFHDRRRDFEKWARDGLRDEKLAKKFHAIGRDELRGEKLRSALREASEKHLAEVGLKIKALGLF